MQPQLKSKVRCADREVGEVAKVIMDPLSHEVSHLVVSMNGTGERQVSMGSVQTVTDDLVQLRSTSSEVMALPPFKRDDYVTLHEVEIPGLEKHVHVAPGEEVEHVLREPFVGYPRQVVLALVELERAVGDEPGGLLDDLPREVLIHSCGDQKHRNGDVGKDLPGIECHLRFGRRPRLPAGC